MNPDSRHRKEEPAPGAATEDVTSMSHHTFRGKAPHHTIVVGWDNPLKTFYAQVWDERTEELVWFGSAKGEIPNVEDLAEVLAPYGDLPDWLAEQLLLDAILGLSGYVVITKWRH
jgi:hypothetical protein